MTVSFGATDLGNVSYTPSVAPQKLPEPATWVMMLGGIGLLSFVQRMRNRF